VITLVLGGTRSGKSEVAERLAARDSRSVTYVATGQPVDAEMAERIAVHQARRAEADDVVWSTVELGSLEMDLPEVLCTQTGSVLVDSLGTWVAGRSELEPDVVRLCDVLHQRRHLGSRTVLVSEEVGLGVHPVTEVGRRFADVLGQLNRSVAEVVDQVLLVVAGRVLPLDRWDEASSTWR
jgi:adenosyl cobinamide kinase/adenosyl cobinamide phosphate guanylyltransferase